MSSARFWLTGFLCVFICACPPNNPSDGDANGGGTNSGGGSNAGNSNSSSGGSDGSGAGATLSGRIQASDSFKRLPRSQSADIAFMVVAQSNDTGETYVGTTDANGEFQIDLPADESGNTFLTTIVDPDGRAAGAVLVDRTGAEAVTGLHVAGDVSLGTIEFPDEPSQAAIQPGADATFDPADTDPNLVARLNNDGAPVGVGSAGKGSAAGTGQLVNSAASVDADGDGLPDLFDADNDGDGTVDDFDLDSPVEAPPTPMILNFFMNLKVQDDRSELYHTGTSAEVENALKQDTVITFEVMNGQNPAGSALPDILSVSAVETPGPAYMPLASKILQGNAGLLNELWSASDYAFDEAAGRFQAFVIPNALLNAGDTFTVNIALADGTTIQASRMINYVFTSVPRIQQTGSPVGVADYDGTQPVTFDGSQDLTLVFNPPKDDSGAYLTGVEYHFEFFYNDEFGGQLNGQIDRAQTFTSGTPAGFDNSAFFYVVPAADLTLASDDTLTVSLPAELFIDSAVLTDGRTVDVASYKIDIAAQNGGNNAAVMLTFQKQGVVQ